MTARDLRQVRSELVETFTETGCQDATAQQAADEVIAEIRALVLAEEAPGIRAAALTEAADAIDQAADDLEAQAIANDGHAYGRSNRTVAAWRDAAAVPRRMAADPTAQTESKD